VSFLLSKHIQEKIGKKIPKGNVFRRIPKRKSYTLQEKIEGKEVEKDLREAKIRADKATSIAREMKANCEHIREQIREDIHDEWANGMVKEDREERKGFNYGRARVENGLINRTIAQIFDLEKYTQNMIIPRNQQELLEFIQGRDYEETMNAWMEGIKKVARDTDIECS
jgi:hypothetical protein